MQSLQDAHLASRLCTLDIYFAAPRARARARRPLQPTSLYCYYHLPQQLLPTDYNGSKRFSMDSPLQPASVSTGRQRRLALAAIRTPRRQGRLLRVLAKLSPMMQAMCIGVRGSAAASRPGLRPLSTTTQSSIFLPTEVVELPPALGRLLKMALDCACRAAVPTPPTLPPPAPDAHRPTICERLKFERP